MSETSMIHRNAIVLPHGMHSVAAAKTFKLRPRTLAFLSLSIYAHVFLTLTLIYTGSRIVCSLCAVDCMGVKQKSTEISALLKEKDDHIAYIETQLQAHIARTSHIQNRLLSTLDTLDAVQAAHVIELEAETSAKERLSQKLDRYLDFVQTAEKEKDDLRDAVIQLVKKVESSSDYGLWPHSQIRSTNLADPSTRNIVLNADERDSEYEFRAYTAAIVTSLRSERDLHRKAHEQTRQQAEQCMMQLEAQLARRDAELETYINRIDDVLNTGEAQERKYHHSVDRNPITNEPSKRPLSKDEAIEALKMTSTKNQALQLEIQGLFKRLEEARKARFRTPRPTSDRNFDGSHYLDERFAFPPGPSSLLPLASGPSATQPPDRYFHPQAYQEGDDRTLHSTHNIHHPQPIRALDHQIMALTSEIDAFQSERNLLADFVANDQQDQYRLPKANGQDEFERGLLIEEECIRLAHSEKTIRAELETFKLAAVVRERELQYEIDRLRQLMRESPRGHAPPQDLLGDLNGEQSMELLTPLHVSAISSSNTPRGRSGSPNRDSPPIPLPPPSLLFTESSFLSPKPSAILLQSQPPQSIKETQIKRIEGELENARRELEEKESIPHDLRALVEDLRRQVMARSPHGGVNDVLLFDDDFH